MFQRFEKSCLIPLCIRVGWLLTAAFANIEGLQRMLWKALQSPRARSHTTRGGPRGPAAYANVWVKSWPYWDLQCRPLNHHRCQNQALLQFHHLAFTWEKRSFYQVNAKWWNCSISNQRVGWHLEPFFLWILSLLYIKFIFYILHYGTRGPH